MTAGDKGPARVEVDAAAQAGILTLARPPVNALDAAAYEAATEGLRSLIDHAEVRTIILTGEGDRSFCAGTDLGVFSPPADFRRVAAASGGFFDALASSPVPLIGAINGTAVGGGVMMASECDVLIAVTDAFFSVPEVSHGLLGGGSHLRRIAPYFKAMRMLLLGEQLSAEEALANGVVSAVVEPAELLPRALDLAGQLSELEPLAMNAAREIFRDTEGELAAAGYARERKILRELVAARGKEQL